MRFMFRAAIYNQVSTIVASYIVSYTIIILLLTYVLPKSLGLYSLCVPNLFKEYLAVLLHVFYIVLCIYLFKYIATVASYIASFCSLIIIYVTVM